MVGKAETQYALVPKNRARSKRVRTADTVLI